MDRAVPQETRNKAPFWERPRQINNVALAKVEPEVTNSMSSNQSVSDVEMSIHTKLCHSEVNCKKETDKYLSNPHFTVKSI